MPFFNDTLRERNHYAIVYRNHRHSPPTHQRIWLHPSPQPWTHLHSRQRAFQRVSNQCQTRRGTFALPTQFGPRLTRHLVFFLPSLRPRRMRTFTSIRTLTRCGCPVHMSFRAPRTRPLFMRRRIAKSLILGIGGVRLRPRGAVTMVLVPSPTPPSSSVRHPSETPRPL